MWSIFDILYKNFQEDQLNFRRFPGFPAVVDTLLIRVLYEYGLHSYTLFLGRSCLLAMIKHIALLIYTARHNFNVNSYIHYPW